MNSHNLNELISEPLPDPKQNLSENLARAVIADGEDYVTTYHHGDIEGIDEDEYWVVSVTRRKFSDDVNEAVFSMDDARKALAGPSMFDEVEDMYAGA